MMGMDDLLSMLELKKDGYLVEKKRNSGTCHINAEEIIEMGGYFKAVEEGMFVMVRIISRTY